MMNPAEHLLCAKRLFPQFGEKRRHLRQRHPEQIGFFAFRVLRDGHGYSTELCAIQRE